MRLKSIEEINKFALSISYGLHSSDLPENIEIGITLNQEEYINVCKEILETVQSTLHFETFHRTMGFSGFTYTFSGINFKINKENGK